MPTRSIPASPATRPASKYVFFSNRTVSCLVNPRAGRELDFNAAPAAKQQRIAVVGAGPAGLACAIEAAQRGHSVDLFEAGADIGGQLNIAKRVPEKTEFDELLRYFRRQVQTAGVHLHLNTVADAERLAQGGYAHIVIAAGIEPRKLDIPCIEHPMVASYLDILGGRRTAGQRVAIIGTGGIAHDVAEFLLGHPGHLDEAGFYGSGAWIPTLVHPGGLSAPAPAVPGRRVALFQRTPGRIGNRLGVSTGWVLRGQLKKRGVESIAGCTYVRIDDRGLHYTVNGAAQPGQSRYRRHLRRTGAVRMPWPMPCRPAASRPNSSAGPNWHRNWTPCAPSMKASGWPYHYSF